MALRKRGKPVNRREFLTTTAAAAVVPLMPALASPVVVGVDMARAPSVTMWAVGTWGEYNWQPVAAETEEDAIRQVAEWDDMVCPDTGELEVHYDATRCKAWDNLKRDPTPADWLRANMGHICDRCGYEVCSDDGHPIGDLAICEGCVTLDEWEIIDPERAADIRGDHDYKMEPKT